MSVSEPEWPLRGGHVSRPTPNRPIRIRVALAERILRWGFGSTPTSRCSDSYTNPVCLRFC